MKKLNEFKVDFSSKDEIFNLDSEERKALLSVSKGKDETSSELFQCLEFAKKEAKELGLYISGGIKSCRKDRSYLKNR